MANLFTAGLAAVGIGGSVLSASEQAKSAQITGEASSSMYLYQAGIAEQNSKIARTNAAWQRITGEQQAYVQGAKDRSVIGQTRAALGASGLDVNSGSAKEIQDSQHSLSSQAQTTIRSNAAQAAYAYDISAAQDRSQASAYRSASQYALEGADVSSTASIIGGATSVASKWLQADQSGAFSGVSKTVGSYFS